jgi:hypothetical protein
MPIYIGRTGQKAEDRRQAAIDQEKRLAERRASLLSGDDAKKKRDALREYATLHNIRKGDQEPPVEVGEGYGKPFYDRTKRCWKAYALGQDGNRNVEKWKAWCVNVNAWLSSAEYESSRTSR